MSIPELLIFFICGSKQKQASSGSVSSAEPLKCTTSDDLSKILAEQSNVLLERVGLVVLFVELQQRSNFFSVCFHLFYDDCSEERLEENNFIDGSERLID